MRNTLKAAGATALAAATVVTGLSFGYAATATPHALPAGNTSSSRPADGTIVPLFAELDNHTFWGIHIKGPMFVKQFADRAQARSEATSAAVTQVSGSTFRLRIISGPLTGQCLDSRSDGDTRIVTAAKCIDDATALTIDDEDRIVFAKSRDYLGAPVKNRVGTFFSAAKTGEAVRFEGFHTPLSVKFEGSDIDRRTAWISGTARPGSSVVIDGKQTVHVDDHGRWSAVVHGLNFGDTAVHVENWIDKELVAEKDITVHLDTAPLDAFVNAGHGGTSRFNLLGSAQPRATITVRNKIGALIATSEADRETGFYEASLPAPNAHGFVTFVITQSLDGIDIGSLEIPVNYGAGVTVTRPQAGSNPGGSPITFAGTGQAGGAIQVAEEGKSGPIASGTVMRDGNWSIKDVKFDGSEHHLTVTQHSMGDNFTTAKLTLNPGASPAVSTPTAKATHEANVSSNALVSGTGVDSARISIKNNGTEIGTAKVTNGKWATRIHALGTGSHTLSVTQTVGTETSPATTTTVDYGQAITVTSPVNSAVVDGKITFTGTRAAGSEIVVRAANRVPVCKATMTTTGLWSCTDTGNILPMGKYNVLVEQVAKGNLLTTANASVDHVPAGYVKPSVTTPASGSTENTARPTFTGKATPNATIRVKNAFNTTIIDTRANTQGIWTATPTGDLTTGTNNLTVTQIVNPGGHTDTIAHTITITP